MPRHAAIFNTVFSKISPCPTRLKPKFNLIITTAAIAAFAIVVPAGAAFASALTSESPLHPS
jgi:hypothetical protein